VLPVVQASGGAGFRWCRLPVVQASGGAFYP